MMIKIASPIVGDIQVGGERKIDLNHKKPDFQWDDTRKTNSEQE